MKCDAKLVNRIKRINGQLNGIVNMLDEERTCEEMLTQLSAVRTGIDRVMTLMAAANFLDSMGIEQETLDENALKALELLIKQ